MSLQHLLKLVHKQYLPHNHHLIINSPWAFEDICLLFTLDFILICFSSDFIHEWSFSKLCHVWILLFIFHNKGKLFFQFSLLNLHISNLSIRKIFPECFLWSSFSFIIFLFHPNTKRTIIAQKRKGNSFCWCKIFISEKSISMTIKNMSCSYMYSDIQTYIPFCKA